MKEEKNKPHNHSCDFTKSVSATNRIISRTFYPNNSRLYLFLKCLWKFIKMDYILAHNKTSKFSTHTHTNIYR